MRSPKAGNCKMKKQPDLQIELVKKELEECKGKYLRALADYQNLEKRVVAARFEEVKYAAQNLVMKLLPVIDVLEQTEKMSKDQGLGLAIKQFRDVLASEMVKKIEVIGKKFDPHSMECVEVIKDGKDEVVMEEVRPGYMMGEKLLRAARVKVGKKIENKETEELAEQKLQKGNYM